MLAKIILFIIPSDGRKSGGGGTLVVNQMILYKGLTMRMNDILGCFLSLAQWGTGLSAAATFQTTLIKANVQH